MFPINGSSRDRQAIVPSTDPETGPMSKPTRALALSPSEQPPPRPVSDLTGMLISTIAAAFVAGVMVGHMIGPPLSERCESAQDTIACLIALS